MNDKQRKQLMGHLWPDACQTQGWKVDDRDLRVHVCSIAVCHDGIFLPLIRNIQQFRAILSGGEQLPRVLESCNEINDGEDFTLVKGLLLMLADRLQPGPSNKAIQKRFVIGEQMKCIALYHPNPAGYLAEIIKDKFKHGSRAMPLQIEDLSDEPIILRGGRKIPSQLDQVIMKLNGALHNKRTGMRVKARDTIHDMKTRAGVKCDCRQCLVPMPARAGVAAVAAGDPDWNV